MLKKCILPSFFIFMLIASFVSCVSTNSVNPVLKSEESTASFYADNEDELIKTIIKSEKPEYSVLKLDLYEDSDFSTWEIYVPTFKDSEFEILQDKVLEQTKFLAKAFRSEISFVSSERETEYQVCFSYQQNFTVSYFNEHVAVLLEIWGYSGGNHGRISYCTFCWNRKTQCFEDIFDVTHMTIQEISEICRKTLVDSLDPSYEKGSYYYEMYYDWIMTGTQPESRNFLNYTFFDESDENEKTSGRGIEIIFDPYSVGPYSAGTQTVRILLEN